MPEVQDVHQAEHQCHARGYDEDDHAHRQARKRQRDPGRKGAHQRQRDGGQRGDQQHGAQLAHAARMDDAAVVHDRDVVADLLREVEVLLDQQDGGGRFLEFEEGVDHVLDDGGRKTLAGLVDQQQPARLDDGARHRQHLLLSARQLAGRMQPEF
ncbi:hypothetical protein G6F58_012941 [Rhizopus delemar]|nr:hypothetical protein G6F58_012941 [Rhizopus delemar]